jgi:hypothetical protein
MTYRGHVKGGQITLDKPVPLPEGSVVNVNVELVAQNHKHYGQHCDDREAVDSPDASNDELSALLLRHAGKGKDLPADLAANHDHYAHGKPNP